MLNQRQASVNIHERIKPPLHPMVWAGVVGIMMLGVLFSVPLLKNRLNFPLLILFGVIILLAFWEIGQQAYRAGRNLYLWQYTRTCTGQVVELNYDADKINNDPHNVKYVVLIEFPGGPRDQMVRLRAHVSRNLYLQLKPGGPVGVQYSKANPAMALIEGE